MSERLGSSHSKMKRSDPAFATSSSDHSMEDAQPSQIESINSEPPELSQPKSKIVNGTGRRRKAPGSVTPNACSICKKARAKVCNCSFNPRLNRIQADLYPECDGAKPSCQRCVSRSIADECRYDLHTRSDKEQMIQEIQRLQRQNEHLKEENDSLGKKGGWGDQIIQYLEDDDRRDEIVSRLKRGESHQAIVEWLDQVSVDEGEAPSSPSTSRQRARHSFNHDLQELTDTRDLRYWTNVPEQPQMIQHLISLYFTWIHPSHMVLDKWRFMGSFHEFSNVHCSHALVSAICAVACPLLHYIDKDGDPTRATIDALRDNFMQETRERMRDVDHGKMTTLQTYGIMFLAEFGSGHSLLATSYLRLAVEILMDKWSSQPAEYFEQVTIQGILSLHTVWSGFTYQKPQAPIAPPTHSFPGSELQDGNEVWCLYRRPEDINLPKRLSHAVLASLEYAKLLRIVRDGILLYCGSYGKVAAYHLLGLFQDYLTWKDDLPIEVRDVDSDFLPHVLFLHIQYHTALIQLLQPMLHLPGIDESSYEQLQSLVVQHGTAGLRLVVQYRNAYSGFYLSPVQLLCLVQLADTVLRYDGAGETTPQTIHLCLTSLEAAKANYPVASALEKMFRNSLAEYKIPVPAEIELLVTRSDYLTPEELLDACTRATYRQPLAQILPQMQENSGQEFIIRWQHLLLQARLSEERSRSSLVTSGSRRRVDIGSLLN